MAKHTRRSPLSLFFRFLVLLGILLLPVGCPLERHSSLPDDDMVLAEKALRERDVGDAEMHFERYLRKNPSGIHRWKVWHQLLSISLDIRQEKVTAAEYLEIMLEEFTGDPEKRRKIQVQLAALYNDMRVLDRAVELWEALSTDEGTPDEMRAEVYRQLSRAYLRRLEFTLSTDMLDRCLELDVLLSTKAECMFALAETQMLTEALDKSEKTLREMLRMEGLSPRQRVLAVFTLADVLEQLERYDEARQLFESIHDDYPNTGVIEVRLASLRNRKTSRPPASKGK